MVISNVSLILSQEIHTRKWKQPNHDNTSVRINLPSFIYNKSCSFSWNIAGTVIQSTHNTFSLTAAALYAE